MTNCKTLCAILFAATLGACGDNVVLDAPLHSDAAPLFFDAPADAARADAPAGPADAGAAEDAPVDAGHCCHHGHGYDHGHGYHTSGWRDHDHDCDHDGDGDR
jgi:hypothetical protein